MKDRNGKNLKVGDIVQEDIYTTVGDKIGSIIFVVKGKYRGVYTKEIIADNGGVGFLLKGGRGNLMNTCQKDIEVLGTNYQAKGVKLSND